jgi:hypothetical protein
MALVRADPLTATERATASTVRGRPGRTHGGQLLGPCETGGVIIDVTGTGHSTQLGNYSGHYRECLDPTTGAVTSGKFTLTATNGDEGFGTYSGQAFPTDDATVVNYKHPGVITGGTGRFAGAGRHRDPERPREPRDRRIRGDHHRPPVAPRRGVTPPRCSSSRRVDDRGRARA